VVTCLDTPGHSQFQIETPKRTWILDAENEEARQLCITRILSQQTVVLSPRRIKSTIEARKPRHTSTFEAMPARDDAIEMEMVTLRDQLDASQKHVDELERKRSEDEQVIAMLRSQLDALGKENISYVRLVGSVKEIEEGTDGQSESDLRNELGRTKRNLIAQLSHVSYLNAALRQSELETLRLKTLLDSVSKDSGFSELKSRYNFIERKLALLCLKHNELPDDPVTIDMINNIEQMEAQNQTLRERYVVAFVSQIKYQELLQGHHVTHSPLQVYEEILERHLAPEEYENWIRQKLEVHPQ